MSVVAVVACFAIYVLGYRVYSRYLATRVFGLRADVATPAHVRRDGVDYVPTPRIVLFGHHYASITGLSPMLGPAIAVIWGWLPAMVWVVLGAILIGCVHDFGALVVSARAGGQSIGKVAEGLIGARAKSLLHAIIFFGVALAMGVFALIVADLFRPSMYPQAVMPSAVILALALAIGFYSKRGGKPWGLPIALAFAAVLAAVVFSGRWFPVWDNREGWIGVLLVYAFAASVLPVWSLLQPRDFLNSLLLYLGLGVTYVGFFVMRPEFAAPVLDPNPEGAPSMFPFVFIVIACGAASGFHSLVASGTTAKQLDRETDARAIGYGAMIGESLLGLAAVLACTAGFASRAQWTDHYASWSAAQGLASKMASFVEGCTRFVSGLGIPDEAARALIAVVVVSFALTTLDSATRLLRYNVEEIGQTLRFAPLGNRYLSSLVAVAAIGFFAFYRIDGAPAGLALWQLFGSVNQLLAGLALLVVAVYLATRGRPRAAYWIPMLFMLVSTLVALAVKLAEFASKSQWLLLTVGTILATIAVALVIEAGLALRRHARAGGRPVRTLDIVGPSEGAGAGDD